jgi:hypothetical protein
MNWRIAFQWTRNIFAVIGVLGSVLFGALAVLAFSQFEDYENRAPQPPGKQVATLESAQVLMTQAGIRPPGSKRLLAGINPVWDGSPNVEAYCLEAQVHPEDQGWQRLSALEPFLASAADDSLALAHKQLACVPTLQQVRERQLELKLISLAYDNQSLETVRIAVRDPITAQVFLVAAWHPPRTQPAARALL